MPEVPTPQPEDFKMKGDFSHDVHSQEFREELREAGEKSPEQQIEEIKRELFDREMPAEYQSLVNEAKFIKLSTRYSENLAELFVGKNSENGLSNLGNFLANEVKGNMVLDLGCGRDYHMNSFSEDAGASLYIGVDLKPYIFMGKSVPGSASPIVLDDEIVVNPRGYLKKGSSTINNEVCEEVCEEDRASTEPEYSIERSALQIQDDMLRATSRMKSNSIKLVIISGIELDWDVRRGDQTDKYVGALEKEINRVLVDNGLLLNYQSDVDLSDADNVKIGDDEDMTGLKIRRKR